MSALSASPLSTSPLPPRAGDAFGAKAAAYATARPEWQEQDIDALLRQVGLPARNLEGVVIVDMGAGTGLLTRKFLERGAEVIAIEPNEGMREALKTGLGHYPGLTVVDGDALNPNLPSNYAGKIDLVVSGNAQHWWGRRAPGRGHPKIAAEVAAAWKKAFGRGSRLAVAFNKPLEDAAGVRRIQAIGMKYFPEKMNSPFAPAKKSAFRKSEFSAYFGRFGLTYRRQYQVAFEGAEKFNTWLTSHSFISNEAMKSGPAAEEFRGLYESLPRNSQGQALVPFRVTVYAGRLK